MAFGGSLNIDFMSDETSDLPCTMCKRKGIIREAEKYCVECNDNYCLACVKVHEDVPSLTGHKILDKAQKLASSKQTSSRSQLAAPTERCDRHTHYYIDTFCQNHDEVGCATCMAVDHRSCKQIFYIPEFLQNNPSTSSPKQVQQNLDGVIRTLSEVHEGLQRNKHHLLKGKTESLGKIRKFRKDINDRLDEMEKSSVDEIESIYKALISKIDDALGRVQTTKSNVTSARSKVASPANSVSQAFVNAKKGMQIANNATTCAEDNEVQIHAEDIDFTTHRKLSDVLKEVNALGVISQRNTKVTERSVATSTSYRQSSPLHKSSEKIDAGNAQQRGDLHRVKGKKGYSVKVQSDKCDIVSACTLEDGTIILSDYYNNKLKRLDSTTFNVKDCCDLPVKPWQVCPISKQEVAVCLPGKQVVQFISVGASLRKTKQINTDFACHGLAYCNGNLYISDFRTSVYIYSVSGSKLKLLSKNQPEQELFSDIRSLAVSQDSTRIYVSDFNKGLVILDNNGMVVVQYNDPQLQYAYDCYLTATGSLLVCGANSRNVLQFGPDGELVGEVVKSDENKHYQAVCCNQQMSKMIVGSDSDNNIEVYDLV